jgi:hypothetical protein
MLSMLYVVVGTWKKITPSMAVGILLSEPTMLYVVGDVSLRNHSELKLMPRLRMPDT